MIPTLLIAGMPPLDPAVAPHPPWASTLHQLEPTLHQLVPNLLPILPPPPPVRQYSTLPLWRLLRPWQPDPEWT